MLSPSEIVIIKICIFTFILHEPKIRAIIYFCIWFKDENSAKAFRNSYNTDY